LLLAHPERRSAYIAGLVEYLDNQKVLLLAYELLIDRSHKLLARARATLRVDERHDTNIFLWMPRLDSIRDELITDELTSLLEEQDEVAEVSRKELDRYGILKNPSQSD